MADVPAIVEQWQDPELVRRFAVVVPFTAESARSFVDRADDEWARSRAAYLAVVDDADDRVVGGCDLSDLDRGRNGGWADVGYWIAGPDRGRGLATAAVAMLLDWAVAELGIDRFFLEVEPDNVASVRLATHLGFTPDATWRTDHGRRLERYTRRV
jgi:RimJ/RimL family protein N-acetyltransferase